MSGISVCTHCHRNKTALRCDSCAEVSCKSCVQFIDEEHFEMFDLLPSSLQNKTYCMNCYNQGVGEEVARYSEIVEKAKKVDVFSISQTKETRRIKRSESPLHVEDCADREGALLKLAFLAADKGFSTIVDVALKSKKVGEGKSYKKLVWSGRGIPVDPAIKK